MDLFRVAVVQAGSVPFDRERSTMKALNLAGQAIRSGARLIVFPEAFISGYPKGIDFGARVRMRSPEGRKWFRTYFESAIMVPGSEALLQERRIGSAGSGLQARLSLFLLRVTAHRDSSSRIKRWHFRRIVAGLHKLFFVSSARNCGLLDLSGLGIGAGRLEGSFRCMP
jgi:Carbon-nitrogen hydrolase